MPTPMAPTSMSIRRPTPGCLTAASASAEVPSIDHLIRPRQQRGRDREAEGLGGLEVDDESRIWWVARRLASPGHELMVSALGNVIPRAHQRLELREGRVHLPGYGGSLGFFAEDLHRQLLEIAQHRRWELENLDLALELRPEALQRDRVLRVVVREAIDLQCRGRMVEHPPQVDRERLVRLLVEGELGHRAGLLPPREE